MSPGAGTGGLQGTAQHLSSASLTLASSLCEELWVPGPFQRTGGMLFREEPVAFTPRADERVVGGNVVDSSCPEGCARGFQQVPPHLKPLLHPPLLPLSPSVANVCGRVGAGLPHWTHHSAHCDAPLSPPPKPPGPAKEVCFAFL